jgi:putative oxidoreductase
MKKQSIIEVLSTFLLVMFLYTAFSKFFDWASYKRGMQNQHFSDVVTNLLIFTLPPIEIAAGTLLIFTKTRLIGLLTSLMLMLGFTGYVGLIVAGYFLKVPCPCGGALKELTWTQHLIFNSFFLLIAMIATIMEASLKRHQGLQFRSQ